MMILEVINNIRKYFEYSVYSARCSLMAEVAGSYLNWIWWLLEPLGNMCVYLVVFGYFFNSTERYYASFIYIGVTMWGFFNGFILSSSNTVRSNRALVVNIYIPKYILLINSIFVFGFKMVLSFMLVAISMLISGVQIGINILYSIPTLMLFFLFCYGCGLVFMHYGIYVSDLQAALRIALHIVMYLSGVFYSIDSRVPQPYGKILLHINPMAFFIDSFRNSVLYNQKPEQRFLFLWFSITMALIWFGLRLVTRNENDYAKVMQ